MTKDEAIKKALTLLNKKEWEACDYISNANQAADILEEALAQPEQKPVAWMLEEWGPDSGPYFEIYHDDEMGWRDKKEWTPLYTTPPQRTWVGLTEAQCGVLWKTNMTPFEYYQAIEAKLKEKNT